MEPRLKSRQFGDPEARQIAKVILFIAEKIKKTAEQGQKQKELIPEVCRRPTQAGGQVGGCHMKASGIKRIQKICPV